MRCQEVGEIFIETFTETVTEFFIGKMFREILHYLLAIHYCQNFRKH